MPKIQVPTNEVVEGDEVRLAVASVNVTKTQVAIVTTDGDKVTLPKAAAVMVLRRSSGAPGAGGAKGDAILAQFKKAKKPLSAAEVAEKAQCSLGRVHEVIRATPGLQRVARGQFVLEGTPAAAAASAAE